VNFKAHNNKEFGWVVLNQKALQGNILVTGSIGSGKTEGVILPIFEQLLANFKPTPAILAIDPKGTFIPKALELIKRYGLEKQVVHMKLGGEVTFNPIYDKKVLKNARFQEIAQMIRSAAVNFMGRTFDAPFWEISAFNLVKNSLIYCGVHHNYYTLNELYKAVLGASSKDGSRKIIDQLESAFVRKDKLFDEEEQFNIRCAIDFFGEYAGFDEKIRSGILATSTSFLNQFREYQASKIFCPKEDDRTILSMDALIDEQKILLFDIRNPGLARSMGTFVKLDFQKSILDRLGSSRSLDHMAGMIIDECQEVTSVGGAGVAGDDKLLAKGREANAFSCYATQSIASLENAIGKEKAAKELFQNFRTKIACHSSDSETIRVFKELAGQTEIEKESSSISELSQNTQKNHLMGGFDASGATISESRSRSSQKDYVVSAKEFSELKTFEAIGQIYDGVETKFQKLYLKPLFLKNKRTPHTKVLEHLRKVVVVLAMFVTTVLSDANAYPTICSVVKTKEFNSCLDLKISGCMCPGPPPYPCALFNYYVPQTFIEVHPNPSESFFGSYPGASAQLSGLSGAGIPFGALNDHHTQSFQAHTLAVPFTQIPFEMMACGGARQEKFCFDAMSEHVSEHWRTGSGDTMQPNRLAWSISPKACLLKGAATSISGEPITSTFGAGMSCSYSMDWMKKFAPSTHSACNGWGFFYPRMGTYTGDSPTAGALMIGARILSLSTEVFQGTPGGGDQKLQMITPQSTSCFREGQNMGILEIPKNVNEVKRMMGIDLKSYLFTTWKKVSCCKNLSYIASTNAAIGLMNGICQGIK